MIARKTRRDRNPLRRARACPDCHSMRRCTCPCATFTEDGEIRDWQFGIACPACGLIEGDAPTVAEAVARWNEIPRTEYVKGWPS
jgi:hypothetical protein